MGNCERPWVMALPDFSALHSAVLAEAKRTQTFTASVIADSLVVGHPVPAEPHSQHYCGIHCLQYSQWQWGLQPHKPRENNIFVKNQNRYTMTIYIETEELQDLDECCEKKDVFTCN